MISSRSKSVPSSSTGSSGSSKIGSRLGAVPPGASSRRGRPSERSGRQSSGRRSSGRRRPRGPRPRSDRPGRSADREGVAGRSSYAGRSARVSRTGSATRSGAVGRSGGAVVAAGSTWPGSSPKFVASCDQFVVRGAARWPEPVWPVWDAEQGERIAAAEPVRPVWLQLLVFPPGNSNDRCYSQPRNTSFSIRLRGSMQPLSIRARGRSEKPSASCRNRGRTGRGASDPEAEDARRGGLFGPEPMVLPAPEALCAASDF